MSDADSFNKGGHEDMQLAFRGLALLHLLVNDADRPSLRVWLGLGDANGRAPAYARLRKVASEQNVSEWDLLKAITSGAIKLNVSALV
jgi:hypothetical protein